MSTEETGRKGSKRNLSHGRAHCCDNDHVIVVLCQDRCPASRRSESSLVGGCHAYRIVVGDRSSVGAAKPRKWMVLNSEEVAFPVLDEQVVPDYM
jgi:hypothetical protein